MGQEARVQSDRLGTRFSAARRLTESLCAPLEIEDYVIQSTPDASPPKWHLAHTTWFFDTFLLKRHAKAYRPFDPSYHALFNSYYSSQGEAWRRDRRGLLSRPTVEDIYHYRAHVDDRLIELLESGDPSMQRHGWEIQAALELGIHHEEQHQELILMDLKHHFYAQPLRPAYRESLSSPWSRGHAGQVPAPLSWVGFAPELCEIGVCAGRSFSFDCERPRHKVYVAPFFLASRLVSQGEYLEFMDDGGYSRPELWLAEGWATKEAAGWKAPLYWEQESASGRWSQMTLFGMQPLREELPVSHVSYFEAEAYARYRGARLPSEAEWESVAQGVPIRGNFLEDQEFEPLPARSTPYVSQLYGDLWEWTSSPFLPYPGFRPEEGEFSEYNGKFMCNQMVLKGGSFATPSRHIRASYRNFYPPSARWPFSGIRLARDALREIS